MSGKRPVEDLGAEREIDLQRWLDAAVARWWIPAIGLVIGVVIGGLYTLSGGTQYIATALIAPGQAFSPSGGTTVLSYLTGPRAIRNIATAPDSLQIAATKAGMSVGELSPHVTTAAQAEHLIEVTVQLSKPKRAEDAANALAAIVRRRTTLPYVIQSIGIYNVKLANYAARLETLQKRIKTLNQAYTQSSNLPALDRLVLVDQLDSAEATLGATLSAQTLAQQQLVLSRTVEEPQLVQPAIAEKVPAHSRRSSVLDAAMIGLILGTLVAVVVELRSGRGRAAPAPA
jgi:hypothetical protein